jgi:hypothetical protein
MVSANKALTSSSAAIMPEMTDKDSLLVPLFEVLDSIGFGKHESSRYFNTGTLFWSLTRLFGSYERIMSAVVLSRENRPFLDADIENFIIRFRIVLNDVAYVIWQLLPPNARGLKGPKGGVHPKNREVSFFTLKKYFLEQSSSYPELSQAFTETDSWTSKLRNDRDNVVHYKATAVVFESQPPSFALLNAAGTEQRELTPEGGYRLVTVPIEQFVNEQLLALHEFLHSKLAIAVKKHAQRMSMKSIQAGWDHRISCIGISTFREHNGI